MRLRIRTNLAARILMCCALNPGRTLRAADIAEACNASPNHLAQVIHQLQLAGYLATRRGRSGGLMLARPAEAISIGQVFRLFEASVPFTECFASENTCPLTSSCRLRGHIARAVEAFYHELDNVTLGDLTSGNCGLEALLALAPDTALRCSA